MIDKLEPRISKLLKGGTYNGTPLVYTEPYTIPELVTKINEIIQELNEVRTKLSAMTGKPLSLTEELKNEDY